MDYNLQKYIAFLTAVDNGSITGASEILNYSQSGISRMIGDLEKEWHMSLLERNKYGVELTSEGTKLLPLIRGVCNEFQNLSAVVDELQGLETGLIRIGTISSAATHILPNVIKRFRADYGGVRYEVLLGDYNEIENWVQSGRIDVGFVLLPTRDKFDTIAFYHDEMMVLLPKGHRLTEYDRIPLKEIGKESFILQENDNNTTTRQFFTKHGVSLNVEFATWDDYAIMSMVESGLGISVLPDLILKRCPYDIELRPLEQPFMREMGIIMKNREKLPIAMKRFLEYMDLKNDLDGSETSADK
jgi:DNA-binding transcriptional LysR family regulator